MPSALNSTRFAYVVVAAGVVLAFVAAVVPHYTAGYRLVGSVLFAGLLPYFVLGLASAVLAGWSLYLAALLLLAVDVVVRVPARFFEFDGTIGPALWLTPILMTVVVLPAAALVGRFIEHLRARPTPSVAAGRDSAAVGGRA